MSKMTKLIAAVTGLLVAVGTLVGTISMTIGNKPESNSEGITIILNSADAYAEFIANHPSNG